jgi:hypothetical protein
MDEITQGTMVRRLFRGAAVAIVFVVLYVLSMGPAIWLCTRGQTLTPWETACATVYWPVVRVAEMTGGEWLDAYCQMWINVDELEAKPMAGLE